MFRNYLKTALRSMLRKKGYSFINIAGLTLGLACCLIIFQYVAFEFSFDRFHENEGDLYRVLQAGARGDDELGLGASYTGFALAPTLSAEVPDIRHATRMHVEFSGAIVSTAADPRRVFEERELLYVDPAFMDMFSFPLAAGDASLAPGTILLTESAAERYFGTENPIGQMLNWTGVTQKSYMVTGVLRDVPANSHLQFQFFLPMEDLLNSENYLAEPEGGWSWNNFATYVQLHPGSDEALVEQKLTDVYLAHRGDDLKEEGFRGRLNLQPLADVHLNSEVAGDAINSVVGSYRTVYFFSVIGLITLLIALFNYINLATARALDRAREVGVRKVVGAQRRQLVVQFLFESALANAAAAVLAIGLAVLLMPVVNAVAGTRLTGALWTDPVFWAAFLVTLGGATLLAGLYPAFVLSSFRPVTVLKGRSGSIGGKLWLRRSLVVLQFAATVVLIGGTVVVYDQLNYMRGMDLGLDIEQVLTVTGPRVFPEGTDPTAVMNTFRQELERLPGVHGVATSASLPGQGYNWHGASFRRSDEDPSAGRRGVVAYIDSSFAELYGLQLAAGQEFADISLYEEDEDSESEDVEEEEALWPVMANETVVQALGYGSPAEAVGQPIYIGDNAAYILGVYRDFNWMSAHEERDPVFFGHTPAGLHVSLRVSTADLPRTVAAVEDVFTSLFPGNVFKYAFADETFDQQYQDEERFVALFTFFAGLAVIIACLGLFGLASFTARQRTKEIGVRKVLGASVPRLVAMLAQDFLKLVIIATAIALPVAYLMMRRWLEQFAYRVDVDPTLFLLVAVLTLLIALATIAYQSIRAATANPVRSIRVE